MCCTLIAENTGRKKSPFWHHRTTLSGYIFRTKACIDNRKKNLLNSNTSSTCPGNMVNFGLLTAEIRWQGWAPQQISTGFASWQRYCAASSSGRQPNFAALNRGRHLYSAGWPSRWALAHILVLSASTGLLREGTLLHLCWLSNARTLHTNMSLVSHGVCTTPENI